MAELPRVVLSRDEHGQWYVRRVALVEDDIDNGWRAFRCDKHLGGPFPHVAAAAAHLAGLDGSGSIEAPADNPTGQGEQ